jgi:hypothetical protein
MKLKYGRGTLVVLRGDTIHCGGRSGGSGLHLYVDAPNMHRGANLTLVLNGDQNIHLTPRQLDGSPPVIEARMLRASMTETVEDTAALNEKAWPQASRRSKRMKRIKK